MRYDVLLAAEHTCWSVAPPIHSRFNLLMLLGCVLHYCNRETAVTAVDALPASISLRSASGSKGATAELDELFPKNTK